jgi:neutral ceramidase
MKRLHRSILTTLSILTVLILTLGSGTASCVVKVGVGETIITPPIGMAMAGYARTKPSDGVHDDLHARSLVVEGDHGQTAVLMSLSIIDIDRGEFDPIREGINKATGIPVENIVISCTHTHSGPVIGGSNDPYTKTLIDRSIESAVTAWKTRVPGRIGTGSTTVFELGRNDRRMQYGGIHPDPMVGIIKIENANGKLLGVVFNYGCHPSTLDLHSYKFTEDWPFFAIQGIKEKLGANVWAAFFQSAQGDIKVGYTAELSAIGAAIPTRTFEYAERKGRQMTEAVLAALPSVKTSAQADVAVAQGTFDLPAREGYRLSVEEAQKEADAAKALMEEMEKKTDVFGSRYIDAYKVANYQAGLRLGLAKHMADPNRPKTITILQQSVKIGDTAIITFPCEVFSEIGLKVKQQSPVRKTFVFGLASAMGGYLPTADEFKEEGYAALISPFSPKAEQGLIESSLQMIGKVQAVSLEKKKD